MFKDEAKFHQEESNRLCLVASIPEKVTHAYILTKNVESLTIGIWEILLQLGTANSKKKVRDRIQCSKNR